MHVNNMIIRFFFILLFVVQPFVAASAEESKCFSPPEQDLAGSPENKRLHFEQRFSAAENLRQAAASAGAEWLKTESLLARAREEAASGNWNPALQLTAKACQQAELALQQAQYESEAWKSRVIKQ